MVIVLILSQRASDYNPSAGKGRLFYWEWISRCVFVTCLGQFSLYLKEPNRPQRRQTSADDVCPQNFLQYDLNSVWLTKVWVRMLVWEPSVKLCLSPPSAVRIYLKDSPGQNRLWINFFDVNMKQRSSTVTNKLDCENMHIHPDGERNVLWVSEKLMFCSKGWRGQMYRLFFKFFVFQRLNQARRYKVLQRIPLYWPMCQHSAFVIECPENYIGIYYTVAQENNWQVCGIDFE